MTLLWTWGGTFFGYREGDALWTHDGRHVGWFREDEVYSLAGVYLGEIKNEKRLITHLQKKHKIKGIHGHYGKKAGIVRYVNYVGFAMYAGYEDFPTPENLM